MNDNPHREGMDLVARSVTAWLKGFIFLFGVYLVFHSHETPGGGFAGGIVIACAFILLTLVEGQHAGLKILGKNVAAQLASAGALIFLIVAVLNCPNGHYPAQEQDLSFFKNNAISIYDFALALVVSMLLYVIFSVTAAVHVAVRDGQRKMFRKRR